MISNSFYNKYFMFLNVDHPDNDCRNVDARNSNKLEPIYEQVPENLETIDSVHTEKCVAYSTVEHCQKFTMK